MFAQLVAFQVGAYIASRGSRYPDHFGGLLTGFLVWALAVAFAVSLATFAAGALSSGDALTSGVAETIGEFSDATDGQGANVSSDLATAEDTADALAALSWWTVGALSLGPCWLHRRRLARLASSEMGNASASRRQSSLTKPHRKFEESASWVNLGKGCVLWVIGIPLPIIILLFLFGVLN
jgi:hypothetical protein